MNVVELAQSLIRCDTTSGRGITAIIDLLQPMFAARGWSTTIGLEQQGPVIVDGRG